MRHLRAYDPTDHYDDCPYWDVDDTGFAYLECTCGTQEHAELELEYELTKDADEGDEGGEG